ncbi:hypothetical protein ACTFIU_004178 [Dictyostelium citrinum]
MIINHIFTGSSSSLSFGEFLVGFRVLYNEPTKGDLFKHLGGDAALLFLRKTTDGNTVEDIITSFKDIYKIKEITLLERLLHFPKSKYVNLEILIDKFMIAQEIDVEITHNELIRIFCESLPQLFRFELSKQTFTSVEECIESARKIENANIDVFGKSFFNGKIVQSKFSNHNNNNSNNNKNFNYKHNFDYSSPYSTPFKNQSNESSSTGSPSSLNAIRNNMYNNNNQNNNYNNNNNSRYNSSRPRCHHCGRIGHIQAHCWYNKNNNNNNNNKNNCNNNNRNNSINAIHNNNGNFNNQNNNNNNINNINNNNNNNCNNNDVTAIVNDGKMGRMFANLSINGTPIRGLVEAGATISILWFSVAKELSLQIIPKVTKIYTASGQTINTIGTVETFVSLGNSTNKCEFLIVKDKDLKDSCIYGITILKKVGIEEKVYCQRTGSSQPMGIEVSNEANSITCNIKQSTLDKVDNEETKQIITGNNESQSNKKFESLEEWKSINLSQKDYLKLKDQFDSLVLSFEQQSKIIQQLQTQLKSHQLQNQQLNQNNKQFQDQINSHQLQSQQSTQLPPSQIKSQIQEQQHLDHGQLDQQEQQEQNYQDQDLNYHLQDLFKDLDSAQKLDLNQNSIILKDDNTISLSNSDQLLSSTNQLIQLNSVQQHNDEKKIEIKVNDLVYNQFSFDRDKSDIISKVKFSIK